MAVANSRSQATRVYTPLFLDKSGDIRPSVERELVSISNGMFKLQDAIDNPTNVTVTGNINSTGNIKANGNIDADGYIHAKGGMNAITFGLPGGAVIAASYTYMPTNTGYSYSVVADGDVVSKPFWGSFQSFNSATGKPNFTLTHSYGVHRDATTSPDALSHCFVMTDGASYTRTWHLRNDNRLGSPYGGSIWLDKPNTEVAVSNMVNASDINMKENIQPYDGHKSLENIKKFDFKTYSFKDGQPGNTCRGVIAQEVQKIDPIYVWSDNVHLMLNNNQLLLDALAAIKVLEARIAYLESK